MIPQFHLAPFVRSFFEDHLVCRRNASPHTIQSYRDALKLFLRFAAARLKKPATRLLVTDISEETITSFLADLEQSRANSIQTRNHRLVALRTLFAYIASREVLLLDHCRRLADFPRKRGATVPEIRYLEREQINAILAAVGRDTAAGRRDYALLLFMYNTGARVQEVADTRLSWLTLTPPYKVELLGKGRKWRTCPLWESTAQQVRQLLKERQPKRGSEEFLFLNRFGQPFSRSGIADLLDRYVVKASVAMPELRKHRIDAPAAIWGRSQRDPQLAGACQHDDHQRLHRDRLDDETEGVGNMRNREQPRHQPELAVAPRHPFVARLAVDKPGVLNGNQRHLRQLSALQSQSIPPCRRYFRVPNRLRDGPARSWAVLSASGAGGFPFFVPHARCLA
jgi:site-specific recombinase XerD